MESRGHVPTVETDIFVRSFALRSAGLMWFLGAGASASAGIPTAWNMIWDFKRQLYISRRGANPANVADLSDPAVQSIIQRYITSLETLPVENAPDEYAALFEETYPSEADRRTYIDSKIRAGKPSYGHLALATLMRAGKAQLVWTTNFDTLVADACAKVFDGTNALTSASLDAPNLAREAVSDQRWPVEIKLHGDFRSRQLMNTNDELRRQDSDLRELLVDQCRRYGLVVAGYSGRDNSVMDALEAVLQQPNPFPQGLFWLHRGDGLPLPRVIALLSRATAYGVEGGLVNVANFDETLRDAVRSFGTSLDTGVLEAFGVERRIRSRALTGASNSKRSYPVLRMNAVEVRMWPSQCRRVVCGIGGAREVRKAIEDADVDVVAARRNVGVLAFGADADVCKAFDPFGIDVSDLHPIEGARLRTDSQERGLIGTALLKALAREHGLDLERRRSLGTLAPTDPDDERWAPLQTILGGLTGVVPGHSGLTFREGIVARLDWADGRPWLLFEPKIIMVGRTDENRAVAADFARERTVRRYNSMLNDLIAFWAKLLAADGRPLRSYPSMNGINAEFVLGTTSAFSRRSRG